MYKIYINETPLFLISQSEVAAYSKKTGEFLLARYAGKPKFLFNYVDMLEKGGKFDGVVIYSNNVEQLFQDFAHHFQLIEAAGGLVVNEFEELLLIFRRGHWDMAKGKIDQGETPEIAAIREVEEETSLSGIKIGKWLQNTYHTYRTKNKDRVLKKTYWYVMGASKKTLHPQIEEDIEIADWYGMDAINNLKEPFYKNILDLIDTYQTIHQK